MFKCDCMEDLVREESSLATKCPVLRITRQGTVHTALFMYSIVISYEFRLAS